MPIKGQGKEGQQTKKEKERKNKGKKWEVVMEKYKTVSRNKSTNFLSHDNFAKEESLKVKNFKEFSVTNYLRACLWTPQPVATLLRAIFP